MGKILIISVGGAGANTVKHNCNDCTFSERFTGMKTK